MSDSDEPLFNFTNKEWCDLAASSSVTGLVAGRLIAPDLADFAHQIIARELHILLASNCRLVAYVMEQPDRPA